MREIIILEILKRLPVFEKQPSSLAALDETVLVGGSLLCYQQTKCIKYCLNSLIVIHIASLRTDQRIE